MQGDKEIILRMVATSLTNQEHRALRDATDAAHVSGERTWLCNSAGARIAAIIPAGDLEYLEEGLSQAEIAEETELMHLEADRARHESRGSRSKRLAKLLAAMIGLMKISPLVLGIPAGDEPLHKRIERYLDGDG